MSWVRIWVHVVFATKNRVRFLKTSDLRMEMFKHMKDNASKKKIWLDCVNGYEEHAHCLISLGRTQTISEVAHLIKGESSYWINKTEKLYLPFKWQDDYWAVGVSESKVNSVRKYIYNQQIHHQKQTFKTEIDNFMTKHGWALLPG